MKSMKKISIIIFALTIFFLLIPAVQAGVNYTLLKNDYIKNHSGQSIIPFPWEPSTSIKVLPFNYQIPAAPANNFSIAACRDQFEAGSFIINAQKDLSGINIIVPNFYDTQGNTIPSSAIDVRLVKVWYQAAPYDIQYTTAGYYLTPELLLKDDSLVNVDYVNKVNFLKVTINGVEQYIDISNPTGTFPSNAQIHDASQLQQFSLKANENKQIWLTIHVPSNTPTGDYYGNITITAPSEVPVKMNFSVRVLPFDLETAPVEYGLYYEGKFTLYYKLTGLSSYFKTAAQYTQELEDMKDHGVLYPTLCQGDDEELETALALRDTVGLPKDKIYLCSRIGNATDPDGLEKIANQVINWRNHTETHGYADTYFYGIDEATGDILLSQRSAWQTVHNNSGKMFVAVGDNTDAVNVVGDLLDLAVFCYSHNPVQVAKWHSFGKRIFSYGNPQVGEENPEIYRKNFGYTLWNDGYDGAMNYAYQSKYGQSIWNDYDSPGQVWGGITYHYRDHVFAYPTSDGVIDTIQWEGWREGVDDTRYLATLIKLEGSDTSARAIVSDSLSKGEDMATIREKIIAQILNTSSTSNKKLIPGIYQNGAWYLDFNRSWTLDAFPPDVYYRFGMAGDVPVTGDWNGDGITEIGVVRGGHDWFLDFNRSGTWEGIVTDRHNGFGMAGDVPVTGDWNNDGITEIGVVRGGHDWYLDYNRSGTWEGVVKDRHFGFGMAGDVPVTGDWNSDGITEIGVVRGGHDWYLDYNRSGTWEGVVKDRHFGFGMVGDVPVTGDWNGDGIPEIGVVRGGHDWYLDYNRSGTWEGNVKDKFAVFGMAGYTPVVGKWN